MQNKLNMRQTFQTANDTCCDESESFSSEERICNLINSVREYSLFPLPCSVERNRRFGVSMFDVLSDFRKIAWEKAHIIDPDRPPFEFYLNQNGTVGYLGGQDFCVKTNEIDSLNVARYFLETHKILFGLQSIGELKYVRTNREMAPIEAVYFSQYRFNIPVKGGEGIVYVRGNSVIRLNASFCPGIFVKALVPNWEQKLQDFLSTLSNFTTQLTWVPRNRRGADLMVIVDHLRALRSWRSTFSLQWGSVEEEPLIRSIIDADFSTGVGVTSSKLTGPCSLTLPNYSHFGSRTIQRRSEKEDELDQKTCNQIQEGDTLGFVSGEDCNYFKTEDSKTVKLVQDQMSGLMVDQEFCGHLARIECFWEKYTEGLFVRFTQRMGDKKIFVNEFPFFNSSSAPNASAVPPPNFDWPLACFLDIVAHELGHIAGPFDSGPLDELVAQLHGMAVISFWTGESLWWQRHRLTRLNRDEESITYKDPKSLKSPVSSVFDEKGVEIEDALHRESSFLGHAFYRMTDGWKVNGVEVIKGIGQPKFQRLIQRIMGLNHAPFGSAYEYVKFAHGVQQTAQDLKDVPNSGFTMQDVTSVEQALDMTGMFWRPEEIVVNGEANPAIVYNAETDCLEIFCWQNNQTKLISVSYLPNGTLDTPVTIQTIPSPSVGGRGGIVAAYDYENETLWVVWREGEKILLTRRSAMAHKPSWSSVVEVTNVKGSYGETTSLSTNEDPGIVCRSGRVGIVYVDSNDSSLRCIWGDGKKPGWVPIGQVDVINTGPISGGIASNCGNDGIKQLNPTVHVAFSHNGHDWYVASFDGKGWVSWPLFQLSTLPPTNEKRPKIVEKPAFVILKNRIWLYYRSTDSDTIYQSPIGPGFGRQQSLEDATIEGSPSVACAGHGIWLAYSYEGKDANNQVVFMLRLRRRYCEWLPFGTGKGELSFQKPFAAKIHLLKPTPIVQQMLRPWRFGPEDKQLPILKN